MRSSSGLILVAYQSPALILQFYVFTLVHALSVIFIIITFIDAAITARDRVVELTLYVFTVYQAAPVVLSLIVSPRSGVQMVKVSSDGHS